MYEMLVNKHFICLFFILEICNSIQFPIILPVVTSFKNSVQYLHNLQDLLEFRTCDVTVVEELRHGSTHGEVHVQLALGLLQGEFATTEESHDALVILSKKVKSE